MSGTIKDRFIRFSAENNLFAKTNRVIVAISGGMDSVVLGHLFLSIGQCLEMVHCNFMLRGAESDRDEAFVEQLANHWQIPLHKRSFDTRAYAEERRLSIQVAARQLRYAYFEELRLLQSQKGAVALIATAHHANDAVETLLMNLFRGTGIDGLRGIPVKNGAVIRPLLFAQRHEIVAYARQHQLSWVNDSSNEQEDYTRNYIRHTVLPAVEKQFPAVVQNIHDSMRVFRDVSTLYHEAVEKRLKKIVVVEKDLQKIPLLRLEKIGQASTVLFEWLKPYGFTEGQIGEVMKLFHAGNGSYVASAAYRVIRNRAWLVLAPMAPEPSHLHIADALPYDVVLPDGKKLTIGQVMPFTEMKEIPRLPLHEALLDTSALKLPLIIRPWKQGDYFYPLGMAKKKKVARFLIDQKVSTIEKEHVWVVESNKKICWVIGYRIDERFKITPHTRQVIRLSAH